MASGKDQTDGGKEMKDENFDKKIKEILDSYEEAPRHDCWAAIEKTMDRRRRSRIIKNNILYGICGSRSYRRPAFYTE